jgi:hypothetical protein
VGALIEDTATTLPKELLPKFECIIAHPEYTGSAFALNMNQRILKVLSQLETVDDRKTYRDANTILGPAQVAAEFKRFLLANGFTENPSKTITINVAGKNFARFDWEFLIRLPNWKSHIEFSRRVIDPAVLYVDWEKDERLPGTELCLKRAGIDHEVAHRAVDDAWDVISLLRGKLNVQR